MNRKIVFVVVEPVLKVIHRLINRLPIIQRAERLMRHRISDWSLESEYRDMARDKEREAEALEWAEAMIGDIVDPKADS